MKVVGKKITIYIKLLAEKGNAPMKLTVRRTIPFVEDECVTGTDAVLPIGGLNC